MDKHRPISPQRKKQLAWTALVIFVLLTAAVCWFVGRPMLRFVSEPEKFRLWVDGHGLWGRVLYVGMCFLQVVVAIIPGEPLEIAGGYAFGAVWGTWLLMCSLGRLPSVVSSTIGGDALGLRNYQFAVLAFAVTMLISLGGIAIYRMLCRRHARHQAQ